MPYNGTPLETLYLVKYLLSRHISKSCYLVHLKSESHKKAKLQSSKGISCKISHRSIASKGSCLNQLISSKSQDLRIGLVRNSRRREGQISGNCGKTEKSSTVNGLQLRSSGEGNYDRLSPERLPNQIIFTSDDDSFTSVGWEMSHFHYIYNQMALKCKQKIWRTVQAQYSCYWWDSMQDDHRAPTPLEGIWNFLQFQKFYSTSIPHSFTRTFENCAECNLHAKSKRIIRRDNITVTSRHK